MDDFKEKALKVRDLYNQLQDKNAKLRWNYKEHTEGLVGDVGDLMKLVMAKADLRTSDGDLDKELAHELSDCLWCIFVIADELGIELEKTFSENMDQLEKKILLRIGANK